MVGLCAGAQNTGAAVHAKREPSQKTAVCKEAQCRWCVRVRACTCLLIALEAFVCRLSPREAGEVDGNGCPWREE